MKGLMKGLKIGRIFGIEIRFHWSLLILVMLIGYLLSKQFTHIWPATSNMPLLWGFISALGLLASIIIHEIAHSLVAIKNKIQVRSITLIIIGGIAHIEGEPKKPGVEFWMAITGPLASFGLYGVFKLLAYLCPLLVATSSLWFTGLLRCFWLVGWINLVLAIFNLAPGFPMDGGRILRAALWKKWGDFFRATKSASKVGIGFSSILMGFGFFLILLVNVFNGLWIIMIGFFIQKAAEAQYRNAIEKEFLGKTTAEEILVEKQETLTCKKEELLEKLVERMKKSFKGLIFVVENNEVIGEITLQQISKLIEEEIVKDKLPKKRGN